MYARLREILAVIFTDFDGWVVLFESGVRIKNVHPDYAKDLIKQIIQLK
jgi:hypothetical protein